MEFVDHDVKLAHSCPISYLGPKGVHNQHLRSYSVALVVTCKGETCGPGMEGYLECGAANHGHSLSLNHRPKAYRRP